MLSALLSAIVVAPPSPETVMARFKKFMDAHPSFSVDFQVTINNTPTKGNGHLVIRKPNRQIFTMAYGNEGFQLRQDPTGTLELETNLKRYVIYAPEPGLATSALAVSGLYKYTYPVPFWVGDLGKFLGKGAKYSLKAPETINGVVTDHLYAENRTPESGVKLDAYLDAQGRLMRMKLDRFFGDESFQQLFNFTKYVLKPTETDAAFVPIPPAGTSPLTLDSRPYPLQIGEKMPIQALSQGERLTNAALPGSGPTMIVFTYADCDVASGAESTLRKLSALMASKHGTLVEVISSESRPALGSRDPKRPIVWDKNHRLDHLFKPQGSPTFYLALNSGTVENLWFGFDRDHPAGFLAQVAEALNGR